MLSKVAVAAALVGSVSADLPVHCLRHQIQGEWEFTMGPLSSDRPSCGHRHPDNQDSQPAIESLPDGMSSDNKMRVSLSSPDRAITGRDPTGTFTMIYDEGFEVAVEDKTFFAFSRFDMVDGHNVTHCGETLTGWYRQAGQNQFGCYWGKKTDFNEQADNKAAAMITKDNSQFSDYTFRDPTRSAPSSSADDDLLKDLESSMNKPSRAANNDDDLSLKNFNFDTPLGENFHQSVVDQLNGASSVKAQGFDGRFAGTLLQRGSWTAKVYKKFAGKSARELNKMAGLKRSIKLEHAHKQLHRHKKDAQSSAGKKGFIGTNETNVFLQRAVTHYEKHRQAGHAKLSEVEGEASSFIQMKTEFHTKEQKFIQKNIYGLPESWDWSEHNVLDDVINQGDCGSCYTVSTVRMLSARNRIKQGNTNLDPFSISFPLHCAEYNQGCDGGYAFLQSKWSEDVGLIPARCFPYNTRGSCSANSQQIASCASSSGERYKGANHRYVGGYYGGGDEEEIMKELVHNGPVVVSFEPKDDFMYYNNGIYTSSDGDQIHQEWERVDHAVLLVGYGQEESTGKKYWKVQNSWGKDWGENGFFRISRGDNDSGIESIAVAADVDKTDGSVADSFLSKDQI